MTADAYRHLRANWSYPTAVRFGVGRIAELPAACRSVGMQRPLVVTDPGLAKLPLVADVMARLEADGLAAVLFSAIKPNPEGRNIDDGVAAYRAGGHDGVVAIGGGSALDAGKAVAFQAGQTRPLWDFEDVGDWWTRANADAIAPIVAVPTTAGTGSEVGRASVVTHEPTRTKKIIFHPRMLPSVVISDPALTVGLPANITAWTGMDALAHNLEAYCSTYHHPLGDGIAVEGMRLVREWLPRAVADGADLEARAHMLAAASMGAVAFQKGLGGIHALSHPVGAIYDTHHGLTNAVFMPYVLAFNRAAVEAKLARAAAYLGLKDQSFQGFLDWVLALRAELKIPHKAGALGIGADRLDLLAEMAAADPTAGGNPVKVGAAELRTLYERALAGTV
ncbi:MAG: iron-containing alcohol dehydrogenase [Alphaproteobacteria bacterium]|nr:iron-containing alcohol dehydrogenase [Alphaproteobacteria bacterium]